MNNLYNKPQEVVSPNSERYARKIIEMDNKVKLVEQLEADVGPIILINKFNVEGDKVNEFLSSWKANLEIQKRQPGYISAQLHRGIAGSNVFINYAIWESSEQFKKSIENPEFQASLKKLPPGTISSPHLFKKVAVSGICLD
jgi:quinol monooxygenase YgiN